MTKNMKIFDKFIIHIIDLILENYYIEKMNIDGYKGNDLRAFERYRIRKEYKRK